MTDHEESQKVKGTTSGMTDKNISPESVEIETPSGISKTDEISQITKSGATLESEGSRAIDPNLIKPKKSANEVFQDLKSVMLSMDYKLDEVSQFVHLAKEKLIKEAEEYIKKGKLSVLESLFELHDMLFRRMMAMEAGSLEPDNFVINLMDYVQEIIHKHGVDIIIPKPGEQFNPQYMESLSSVPAKFWRVPNTVANVEKCGYSIQASETEERVIRPARVVVYTKHSKGV